MRMIPLIILVGGCASVGVTRMGSSAPPKPEGCNLDVYDDPGSIDRPYREVCLIDAKTGSSIWTDKTMAGAINEARPAACQCGADAILVTGGDVEGASFGGGYGHGKATLRAIVYTGTVEDKKRKPRGKHHGKHEDSEDE
jgi:hypothetical protein